MSQPRHPGSGVAAARAIGALVNTISNIVAAGIDQAVQMQEEVDRSKLVHAEAAIEQAETDFWNWTLTNQDPTTWNGRFTTMMKHTRDKLSRTEGSPHFKRRLGMLIEGKQHSAATRMQSRAAQVQVAQAKSAYNYRAKHQAAIGDYDGEQDTINKAANTGIYTATEIEAWQRDKDNRARYHGFLMTEEGMEGTIRDKIDRLEKKKGKKYAYENDMPLADRKRLITELKRQEADHQSRELAAIDQAVNEATAANRFLTTEEMDNLLGASKTLSDEQKAKVAAAWAKREKMSGDELMTFQKRIDALSDQFGKIPDEDYEHQRAELMRDIGLVSLRPGAETLRAQAAQLTLPAQEARAFKAATDTNTQVVPGGLANQSFHHKMKFVRNVWADLTDGEEGEEFKNKKQVEQLLSLHMDLWLREQDATKPVGAAEIKEEIQRFLAREKAFEMLDPSVLPKLLPNKNNPIGQ